MLQESIVSLENIANGKAVRDFEPNYLKILANFQDPKTFPDTKRILKLEVKINPDENREIGTCFVSYKAKLAGTKPKRTSLILGRPQSGMIAATERNYDDQISDEAEAEVATHGWEKYLLPLTKLANGGACEYFNLELQKVLMDIQDPNKKAKQTRVIFLILEMETDSDRDVAHCKVRCFSKLAELQPLEFKRRIAPPVMSLPLDYEALQG